MLGHMSPLSPKPPTRLRNPPHHPPAEPVMVFLTPGGLHIPPKVPGTRNASGMGFGDAEIAPTWTHKSGALVHHNGYKTTSICSTASHHVRKHVDNSLLFSTRQEVSLQTATFYKHFYPISLFSTGSGTTPKIASLASPASVRVRKPGPQRTHVRTAREIYDRVPTGTVYVLQTAHL